MPLNSTAFIIVTGNALTAAEDNVRRLLQIELDAKMEDPEQRAFSGDILAETLTDRQNLLATALTIWRWGRQQPDLSRGKPLGSFEQWCRWVRDPLLALGCQDPVERIASIKHKDPTRMRVAEIFETWWAAHGSQLITAADLSPMVKVLIDAQNQSRQNIAHRVRPYVGSHVGGFALTEHVPFGKWSARSYRLEQVEKPAEPNNSAADSEFNA